MFLCKITVAFIPSEVYNNKCSKELLQINLKGLDNMIEIRGFGFETTEEKIGKGVLELIDTDLFKLVNKCINNDNIIFYDEDKDVFGTCDKETYSLYINSDSTWWYNVMNMNSVDIENITEKYLLSEDLKKEKEANVDAIMEEFLNTGDFSEDSSEFDKKYAILLKDWAPAAEAIYVAKETKRILNDVNFAKKNK